MFFAVGNKWKSSNTSQMLQWCHKCWNFQRIYNEVIIKCGMLSQTNYFTFIMDNARITHALIMQEFNPENNLSIIFYLHIVICLIRLNFLS